MSGLQPILKIRAAVGIIWLVSDLWKADLRFVAVLLVMGLWPSPFRDLTADAEPSSLLK